MSARELIKSGHGELEPFLEFRDWLAEFRNDPNNRWKLRRNGSTGLGPFSIEARKEILRRIEQLEHRANKPILSKDEREMIHYLWTVDQVPRLNFQRYR